MREELMVGVKIGAAFSLLETQTASFTKQTGEKQREKHLETHIVSPSRAVCCNSAFSLSEVFHN